MKRCASFEFCFLKVKTKPALPLAFSIATQALRVNRMYTADFAHEIPLTSPNGVEGAGSLLKRKPQSKMKEGESLDGTTVDGWMQGGAT